MSIIVQASYADIAVAMEGQPLVTDLVRTLQFTNCLLLKTGAKAYPIEHGRWRISGYAYDRKDEIRSAQTIACARIRRLVHESRIRPN